MKLFRALVYSNLHIALIAFVLSLETNVLFNVENLWTAPAFLFFTTLLIYNLGYYNAIFSSENSYRQQARWLKKHQIYWALSILTGFTGAAILFLHSEEKHNFFFWFWELLPLSISGMKLSF